MVRVRSGSSASPAPLFLPGVALSAVIAVALAPRVARWLGTGRPVAFLLLASLGTTVVGVGCDLSRFGPRRCPR